MRVFVTGGTGFIGTHVVRRLLQNRHQVRCLVRNPEKAAAQFENTVQTFAGDVTDPTSVRGAITGCDAVIHLANHYSYWEPDRSTYRHINVEGTRNVLEAALAAGVRKVVHVSSVVVWGRPAQVPFTEETPYGPKRMSQYAQTKYEGDLVAWQLHRDRGLPLVVVYPGGVLGPGDVKATGQYIQNLMHRRTPVVAFEDRYNTVVDVRDTAEVIVRALEKEGNLGEKYLAAAHRVTYGDFNRLIGRLARVPLPRLVMPGPVTTFYAAVLTGVANLRKRPPFIGMALDAIRTMAAGIEADGSKAERELGIVYRPLEETLADAIGWYRVTDQAAASWQRDRV